MKEILVKKSDGVVEPFDSSKLKKSLTNSNASIVLANEIVDYVVEQLTPKMTTEEIYKIAFEKLKGVEKKTASRYSLRRSLLGLGPTGFPFERFIAKIFEMKGYDTAVGVLMKGKCVEHEVDVVAGDVDDLILCEVKFHNEINTKSDTKVALYVRARYEDLKDQTFDIFNRKLKPTRGVIITNTKFTHNAKRYAKCADLGMISWEYPEKGNLYDLIEETGLQPITSLVSISNSDKEKMIKAGLIDCRDLENNKKTLEELNIPDNKIKKIIEEAKEICSK